MDNIAKLTQIFTSINGLWHLSIVINLALERGEFEHEDLTDGSVGVMVWRIDKELKKLNAQVFEMKEKTGFRGAEDK